MLIYRKMIIFQYFNMYKLFICEDTDVTLARFLCEKAKLMFFFLRVISIVLNIKFFKTVVMNHQNNIMNNFLTPLSITFCGVCFSRYHISFKNQKCIFFLFSHECQKISPFGSIDNVRRQKC